MLMILPCFLVLTQPTTCVNERQKWMGGVEQTAFLLKTAKSVCLTE